MENRSFRKSLAVAVVALFLGVSVIPSVVSDNPSFSKIIYVDDDNTEGPWDGTQEHPYSSIQDAINNTYEHDTIFVYNGTYKKNIAIGGRPLGNESNVNSNINLIGQDRDSTIIDGARFLLNGCGFIQIKGFTINNTNIGINLFYCSNIVITGNRISNNNCGLLLENSESCVIYKNIIDSNKDYAIKCTITITIVPFRGYCNRNEIIFNQINKNKIGIELYKSYLNRINYNNFYDNSRDAYSNNSMFNNLNYNYWNEQRLLPKLIPGLPFFGIDWHPAKEPYDIS